MKLFRLLDCKQGELSVYAFAEKDRHPEFKQFFDDVKKSDRSSSVKITAFFDLFSEEPELIFKNDEKSKHLKDGIFEFKPTKQIRFFFFKDDAKIVITHGYIKKVMKNKEYQDQIGKAVLQKNRYFDEK